MASALLSTYSPPTVDLRSQKMQELASAWIVVLVLLILAFGFYCVEQGCSFYWTPSGMSCVCP